MIEADEMNADLDRIYLWGQRTKPSNKLGKFWVKIGSHMLIYNV